MPFMNNDTKNSDERKLAAFLARKYFKGEIYKWNISDQYPMSDDPEIKKLREYLFAVRKGWWIFGQSKKQKHQIIENAFDLISILESDQKI